MSENPGDIVDDDGHTLADITPMEITEDDDEQMATNSPDDPEEYENWDRDKHGGMWEYATDVEPTCQSGDDAEKGE